MLVATLDRRGRRNAADLALQRALREALAGPSAAVVIAGAGGDFCAGGDLGELVSSDLEAAAEHVVEVTSLPALIETMPRPVVAAVDGYALGTGFEIAAAADAVVATPRAVFGLPETPNGFASPTAIGRCPGIVGRGLTRHLVLRGRRWLSGAEAHRCGLVAELHDPDGLLDAAVALAGEMAASPGFPAVKRLLTLDAGRTYRLAPALAAPLMLSERARETRERFARA